MFNSVVRYALLLEIHKFTRNEKLFSSFDGMPKLSVYIVRKGEFVGLKLPLCIIDQLFATTAYK